LKSSVTMTELQETNHMTNGSAAHTVQDNNNKVGPIVAMPTSALEAKLKTLREKSNQHSQILTQKLASSQSGQSLLHIGTSLSTLPPDLHSLLTQLHPVLSAAETTEQQQLQELRSIVQHANEIRTERRRMVHAAECAELYQDLLAAEQDVKRDATLRRNTAKAGKSSVSFPAAKEEEGSAQEGMGGPGGVLGERRRERNYPQEGLAIVSIRAQQFSWNLVASLYFSNSILSSRRARPRLVTGKSSSYNTLPRTGFAIEQCTSDSYDNHQDDRGWV
jgi:hypothetical protein